ncbi:MAG: cyclodeaminase/cyclohydrolase family protein [Coriobacteriia bacterium]|nr:cyclodeaminase/cyclohydrolase family protein [Coriobacteriia bacterium]
MIDTTFLDELASKAPTPGGGGAAAYAGALGAALAIMVGNLTVGKKKYADVEPQIRMAMDDLEAIRGELTKLIDRDAEAFAPLAACYGMPRSTDEELAAREAAMQEALVGACEVPLEIMRASLEVLEECDFLAKNGSRLALSDVGCAVAMAHAAVHAASLNVIINIKSITDAARAAEYQQRMDAMIAAADQLREQLYPLVVEQISK